MSRRSSYGRVSGSSDADKPLAADRAGADDDESTENSVLSNSALNPTPEDRKNARSGFFSSTPTTITVAPSPATTAAVAIPAPTSADKKKKSSVSSTSVTASAASSSLLNFSFFTPSASSSSAPQHHPNAVGSSCTFSNSDSDLQLITSLITSHPDFPKPGVVFRDIFPIFRDPRATEALMNRLYLHLYSTYFSPGHPAHVDAIAGLETRGFLFGVTLAMRLGVPFIPIRKAGKLPPPTVSTKYGKEYGGDEVELSKNSLKGGSRVVVIDDLLATGGTLIAASELVAQANSVVTECMVVIELKGLKGRDRIEKEGKTKIWSLIQYE